MNYNKKSVTDVDVNGKRVLIRCELNAPQDEHGNVTDATRIVTAVPTVKYLAENGAKVIIITHLGRPKGKVVPSLTIAPIAKEMEKYLGRPIKYVPDIVGEQAKKAVAELKDGEITEWELTPESVGIESQTLTGLIVENSAESLALIKDALGKNKSDKGEKAANMIALNAGAGIYVSGLTNSYQQGVALAHDIIYGGQALENMGVLSEFTKTLKQYEA